MSSMLSGRIDINDDILFELKRCVLLQHLDDEGLAKVIRTSHVKQLAENSILFEQGSPLTDIYLLISGGIKLQRLAANGNEKVMDIIRPGQTFAEAVLFSGGARYPVSALAIATSVVVCIQAKNYLSLLNSSNDLCLSLMAKLSHRLHWMVNEVDRLTMHSATYRLVCYLLSHIPDNNNDRTGISLPAPKHVIASRLSITPETLSRALKELTKQGLIKLEGAQIELVDVDKLRQLILL